MTAARLLLLRFLPEKRTCRGDRTPFSSCGRQEEAGFLPRAHGSALFTRGETQAMVVATLGTGQDEQASEAAKQLEARGKKLKNCAGCT